MTSSAAEHLNKPECNNNTTAQDNLENKPSLRPKPSVPPRRPERSPPTIQTNNPNVKQNSNELNASEQAAFKSASFGPTIDTSSSSDRYPSVKKTHRQLSTGSISHIPARPLSNRSSTQSESGTPEDFAMQLQRASSVIDKNRESLRKQIDPEDGFNKLVPSDNVFFMPDTMQERNGQLVPKSSTSVNFKCKSTEQLILQKLKHEEIDLADTNYNTEVTTFLEPFFYYFPSFLPFY